ncbi:MAG: AraC family transcriptional regulator N-terminal domain-containing protein [Alphaproteobacteria bacterium]
MDENKEAGDLKKLATLIEKYTPHDGYFNLPVNDLWVIKISKIADSSCSVSQCGMAIVVQGEKQVFLGQKQFTYDHNNMVVYGANLPVTTKITKASQSEPYLCLVIGFELKKLSGLIDKAFPHGVPQTSKTRSIYIDKSNPQVIASAIRLMEVMAQEDADLLAPLVVDEILIRLLRSSFGPAIAQIGLADSHVQRVMRVLTWLEENFAQAVKVDDLAEMAAMSLSSFHNHFKNVTSMSPLQYQKTMRLYAARNLMTTQMYDVSQASLEVGYGSLSQFSREYSREFGISPSKDIAQYH